MTETGGAVLHVRVAEWEYGCCGDVPAVGQRVRWDVGATQAEPGERHAIHDVTWIEELALVRFPGGSASRRLRGDDDAYDAPVSLWAGWHGNGAADVVVVGMITDVEEEADGMVVGLRVDEVVEPTAEQVAEERRRLDRDARTVHLTGPLEAFGRTLPVVATRLTVDLDDPRLRQQPRPREALRTGVAAGEVRQVSRSEPTPSGGRYLYDIEPGDPLPDELFVALVLDA